MLVFLYMAAYHIEETKYFSGEEDVVVPQHVLDEHAAVGVSGDENQASSLDVEGEKKEPVFQKVIGRSI